MSRQPAIHRRREPIAMTESPFVTYAQNGEDILLWRALKHVERGFYIDVGAQDPTVDSVTRAFYDHGWRGINLEPVPRWYQRIAEQRPHDINLRLAASDKPGTLTLFEVEESGLSTSDVEFAHRHEAAGHALHQFSVECRTLDQICAEQAVTTVHFLKVDCEGAEKAVLEGIALKAVRPWIIVVEATEPNSTKPTWGQWEHLLTGRGYKFVYFDGLNRYYVADEHAELATAFGVPANPLDGARRGTEVALEAQLAQLRARVDDLVGAAVNTALRAELASVIDHRDRVAAELDRVAADRDRIVADRDRIATERDQLAADRDRVAVDRDRIAAERDQSAIDHAAERGRLAAERAGLAAERDNLNAQYAGAVAAHHALETRLSALLSSTSWRVTKPLRGVALGLRWTFGRCRAVAAYAARRTARMLRPLLQGLAKVPMARRLAVGVLGKRSRASDRTRRFLFGVPRTTREPDGPPAVQAEYERLLGLLRAIGARGADQAGATDSIGADAADRTMDRVAQEMVRRIAERLAQQH